MDVVIRKATRSDTDLVVSSRLNFLQVVRGTEFQHSRELEVETQSFVIAETTGGRLHTWIAEDDDQFAGIVSLLLWPRPPRPDDLRVTEGYIINMYVPPNQQRRGIGKRLLRQCLDSADALAIGRFVLHTTDDGRHLYESAGFSPTQNWMQLAVAQAEERQGGTRT